jgi:hypothetical protein
MVRGKLAVIAASVFFLYLAIARGQEAVPSHGSAEHGMHSERSPNKPFEYEDLPTEDFADAPSDNVIVWTIGALGWRYAILLPFSALASFVLTVVLVVAGKGKTMGAAMAFVVAIPFLIGLFGMFDGMLSSFMIIARTTGGFPKPSMMSEAMSMSLVTPLLGMFLMAPSYLLATGALVVKSLRGEPQPQNSPR